MKQRLALGARGRSAVGAIFLGVVLGLGVAQAEAPPLEMFFAQPAISNVAVSPDGRYFAFLAPLKGRMGIGLLEADTGKTEVLVRADVDIQWFFWKGGERVVFGGDVGGNESSAVRVIDLKTRKVTALIESIGKNNENRAYGNFGGIAYEWRAKPNKLVILGTPQPGAWYSGLFEVDLRTLRRSSLPPPSDGKDQFLGYAFDEEARVRARLRVAEGKVVFEYRPASNSRYQAVADYPEDLHLPIGFEGILADNRTLLVRTFDGFDRGALRPFDLETGQWAAPVFETQEGEITSVQLTRDRTAVAGVRTYAAKPAQHWFVKEYQNIQTAVDRAFPQTINRIVDVSDDGKRWVILSRSDREPGVYSALDLSGEKPRLMPLGAIYPTIETAQLQPMQPIEFTARDGLRIPGYLTLPAGDCRQNLPLVLVVHGGPYGVRDYWEYDPEVQFLASRGYAVLQVNYRGSGGYGRKFQDAGRLEWGAKMQDDLTDAVNWAVAQGLADSRRVAIYGASYGGYAALAGVTFTPQLYRCAINYVGVSDLAMLVRWEAGKSRLINRVYFQKWVHSDTAVLKARSPVNFVERIQVPTLHAYGENDPRVEIEHWTRLKAELERHGKEFTFLREGDEGHGFRNESARVRFFRAVEQFLGKHLAPVGGSARPAGKP